MSLTIISAVIVAILLLAWVPVLITGILIIKKKKSTIGKIITAIGGLWGVFSVIAFALVAILLLVFSSIKNNYNYQEFQPGNYTGQTGRLVLPEQSSVTGFFINNDNNSNIRVSSDNGDLLMPVGSYILKHLQLTNKDSTNWTAMVYPIGTKAIVKIKSEPPTEYRIGLPFNAAVNSRKNKKGQYSFSFKLTDCNGNKASITRSSGNKVPAFELLDQDGKSLWRQKFQYG